MVGGGQAKPISFASPGVDPPRSTCGDANGILARLRLALEWAHGLAAGNWPSGHLRLEQGRHFGADLMLQVPLKYSAPALHSFCFLHGKQIMAEPGGHVWWWLWSTTTLAL